MNFPLVFTLKTRVVFSNGAPSEKSKLKKWNLVSSAKKPKNKGVMDGAPLTQEGICQAYQLIEFLKKEQSLC